MKKNKLISLIVPIYNGEKFLSNLFHMIDSQTYKFFEVLLIDDGSTDLTSKICMDKEKNDSKYHYFYKKNSGVSDSRNLGINNALGEYICFVDVDDGFSNNYLKHFEECLENEKVDFVCCDIMKFRDNITNENEENVLKISQNIEDKYSILFSKYAGYIWNKIYNKKKLIENNIYFKSNLHMCEDLVFNYEYLKYVEKFTCLENKNYYYRISTLSASKNLANQKWFTIFDSFDFLLNKKDEYDEHLYNMICYSYIVNLLQGKYRLNYIDDKEFYKEKKLEIENRFSSLKKMKYKLTIKEKIKVFMYKNFNYISFKYKLNKESNV